MDIDEFKSKAKVQEIPGGFGSTIKHYSMDTKKMKKQAKEFSVRQGGKKKHEAWCSKSSSSPEVNAKKGNRAEAKKYEFMKDWNRSGPQNQL